MIKTELTLIFPGLARIIEQQINVSVIPENLAKIIAKSKFKTDTTGLTRLLLNQFSVEPLIGSDLPIAHLLSGQQTVLKADPCYLHPDRDRLLLFADGLALTQQESSKLITEIQPLLEEFGGELVQNTPDSWLVHLNVMPELIFSALPEVMGKGVDSFLPKGIEQQRWIRLWNEIQMQLYECDINQQRISEGKFPINSVWFWGAGQLELKQQAWNSACGNLSLLEQLCKRSAVELKRDANNLNYSSLCGKNLWVMDELDCETDWQQHLQRLDDVFHALWQHVRSAKIKQLNLHIPEHGCYTLNSLNSWVFW